MNKIILNTKTSFKLINWKLLATIFATLLIPQIYLVIRMHWIGDMPNSYSFSIAGNLEWINVIFEVLEEAFILPLFFVMSKIVKKDKFQKRIVGQIILIISAYVLFIAICQIFENQLINWLAPTNANHTSELFIRLEFVSRLFEMLFKIGVTLLIIKEAWATILILLTIKTAFITLFDIFSISQLSVSMKSGIIGVAADDLIVGSIMAFVAIYLAFSKFTITIKDVFKPLIIFEWKLLKQNFYSGLESFVRNAFFIWFVIKTIGRLSNAYNQGDFWVTNSFIWDWMLMPIFALSRYINRDTAFKENKNLSQKMIAPFILITLDICLWFILLPAYKPFFTHVVNYTDADTVYHLVLISIGFYVMFAYNEVIDKVMYGSGKAYLILFQSLFTNVIVYIPYYYSVHTMTIDDVAIMMSTAIAVDSFITFAMFWIIIWKKQHKNTINSKRNG